MGNSRFNDYFARAPFCLATSPDLACQPQQLLWLPAQQHVAEQPTTTRSSSAALAARRLTAPQPPPTRPRTGAMKAADCRLGALASPSAAQRGGASMPRRAARHRAQASTGGTGRASIGATFVVCWLASFACLQGVPPCMGGDRRQGDIKRIRVARSHADGRGKSGASEAGSRARTSGMDHRRADNSMGDGPPRGSGGAAVKSVGADAPGAVTWEAFAKLCGPQEDSAKAALAGREFEVRWPSATPLPDVAAIVLHCACFFLLASLALHVFPRAAERSPHPAGSLLQNSR